MSRAARVSLVFLTLVSLQGFGVSASCNWDDLSYFGQRCTPGLSPSPCPSECKKYVDLFRQCDLLPEDARDIEVEAIAYWVGWAMAFLPTPAFPNCTLALPGGTGGNSADSKVGIATTCNLDTLANHSQKCVADYSSDLSGCPDGCKQYVEAFQKCDLISTETKDAVNKAIAIGYKDIPIISEYSELWYPIPKTANCLKEFTSSLAAESGGDNSTSSSYEDSVSGACHFRGTQTFVVTIMMVMLLALVQDLL